MKFSFTHKTYTVLKWADLVAIPAAATLYFTLAQIWGLPAGAEVVATCAAVDTCLGAMLGISSKNYQGAGDLNVFVDGTDGGTAVQVAPNKEPREFRDGQSVMLKVNKQVVTPPQEV